MWQELGRPVMDSLLGGILTGLAHLAPFLLYLGLVSQQRMRQRVM